MTRYPILPPSSTEALDPGKPHKAGRTVTAALYLPCICWWHGEEYESLETAYGRDLKAAVQPTAAIPHPRMLQFFLSTNTCPGPTSLNVASEDSIDQPRPHPGMHHCFLGN